MMEDRGEKRGFGNLVYLEPDRHDRFMDALRAIVAGDIPEGGDWAEGMLADLERETTPENFIETCLNGAVKAGYHHDIPVLACLVKQTEDGDEQLSMGSHQVQALRRMALTVIESTVDTKEVEDE